MLATVVYSNNPFHPAEGRKVKRIKKARTINSLAPTTQLPFICLVNGVPVLRENGGWERMTFDGDIVAFVVLPQGGGGGSSPLKLLLTIAIAIMAPQLGAALVGPQLAAVEAIGGLTYGAIAGAVVGFVGNIIVNALLPPPKLPSSQSRNSGGIAASPTYNLQAQGNKARIGEAIPALYGRHLVYPDYAAEPYVEYQGNNQYLYQLFCIGQGSFDVEAIKIEDTLISVFPEIEYQVVQPNTRVMLFPSNVVTAAEVGGQELLNSGYVGGFIANPPTTLADRIGVDVVCPAGLFYANDDGGLNAVGLTIKVEARTVDDAGTPTGSFVVLGTESISGATATSQRRTYNYSVTEGRYEVRMTRVDAKATSPRYGHTVLWEGLRTYIPSQENHGDVTLLALKMRSSDSLSSQTARKVNLIVTRKLPIWNGTTWSSPTATRSIAWALADMCRASYGGKFADSRIDLATLLALDATWSARGDYFDAVFDQKIVLWEALDLAARAGRTKRFMQSGIVNFTRDQSASLPVALFNMRNILRGSLKVEYLLPSDDTADHVVVQYFDMEKQKFLEVTAELAGYSTDNPARVDLFGVTNSAQAWREGMYVAAANRYRRQVITFSTEMEGFIPTFGDPIAIAHERMQRSVSGEVLEYISGTKTFKLSEPVAFASGIYYIALRKDDGSYSGPWEVIAGVDEYHVVGISVLDFTPSVGTDKVRTSFSFGVGDTYRRLARVIGIRPRSETLVEIACVNEDEAVHTADTSTMPPPSSYWNLPIKISRPVINGLAVVLSGTPLNQLLAVSWLTASGADKYVVDTSYDSGATWQRVAETSVSNVSFTAGRGSVQVRVAAVGLAQGDWVIWEGDPYAVPPADVNSFLVNVQPDGTREFTMAMAGGIPADFAGYEIRYKVGTGSYTWDDLAVIQEGIVPTSPWESNQLDAGSYTFAVKAVDTSGNRSLNANFLIAELADQRLAGVIFSLLPRNYGWPGTKTSCYVETDTGDLAANDTTTWASLTTWDAWTQWTNSPASPISYEHTVIDLGATIAFVPNVSALGVGTISLQEAHSDDNITYTSFAAVGSLITARYIKIKATITGSFPRLTSLDIKLSGESLTEEVNDLDTSTLSGSYRIGVGDIRIPHVKSFATITQLQVSLQNVGAGWSFEVIDKTPTFGPRIKIYNASNTLADATIDAYIRGF
jgi:hypothetical protein